MTGGADSLPPLGVTPGLQGPDDRLVIESVQNIENASASSLTLSVEVPDKPRMGLLVLLGCAPAGSPIVSVTYGGQAIPTGQTMLVQSSGRAAIAGLLRPAVGRANVVATFTAPSKVRMTVVVLSNVAQFEYPASLVASGVPSAQLVGNQVLPGGLIFGCASGDVDCVLTGFEGKVDLFQSADTSTQWSSAYGPGARLQAGSFFPPALEWTANTSTRMVAVGVLVT